MPIEIFFFVLFHGPSTKAAFEIAHFWKERSFHESKIFENISYGSYSLNKYKVENEKFKFKNEHASRVFAILFLKYWNYI